MKKLETEFKRWGFDWKILDRTENWALLEQVISDSVSNFNVARIKKCQESNINGNIIPEQELLPSAEQWGQCAWNYGPNKARAEERYLDLAK